MLTFKKYICKLLALRVTAEENVDDLEQLTAFEKKPTKQHFPLASEIMVAFGTLLKLSPL